MEFDNYQEIRDRIAQFRQVSEANEDIANSYSLDFFNKWGHTPIVVPGMFVDWAGIEVVLMNQNPELFGDWSTHLEVSDAIRNIIGEISEPVIEYINLTRKTSIAQRLNAIAADGYVDLVFDETTGSPVYQVSEKAGTHKEDINELINVYGRF